MNKVTTLAVATLTLIAIFTAVDFSENQTVSIVNEHPWMAEQCTESLEVECAVDIELTVKNCAAAFETSGTDVIADIKCAKDLLADKKHCWPCICAEAKKKGWKIIGC